MLDKINMLSLLILMFHDSLYLPSFLISMTTLPSRLNFTFILNVKQEIIKISCQLFPCMKVNNCLKVHVILFPCMTHVSLIYPMSFFKYLNYDDNYTKLSLEFDFNSV
jgi:hypothetical protein